MTPSTLELLTETNIPTQYKVVPTDATDVDTLRQLRDSLRELPNVSKIVLADEQLDVISQAQGIRGPLHGDPVDRPAVRRRSC